tara:strand:+ start:1535 stop:2797 length:1263 start_codon:yes stop_codon:yes gene_type:complete
MPSLLFVTDNFIPENNAPSYRTFAHCEAWKNLNWKITVLTSVPNAPKGKVFPGFNNKLFQTEKIDDIVVYRIWTFIAANAGFYLRILDFLSFLFMAIIASFFIKKHDFVVSTSPQFFAGCSGLFISKIHGAKWILEIRDFWPESIVSVGRLSKESKLYKILFRIAILMYKKTDGIIVVSEKSKEILISYGIEQQKILVAPNGIAENDVTFFSETQRTNTSQIKNRKIRVGYVGTIGEAHALETLINTAEILRDSDEFEFYLVGNGSRQEALCQLCQTLKLSNVHFITSINAKNRNKVLLELDIGIITLKNDPLFETVIPSKIFDYAVAKLPILIGVKGEARSIVEHSGLGFYFEPENASQLARRLTDLKDGKIKLVSQARDEFIESHLRTVIAHKIAEFIVGVTTFSLDDDTPSMNSNDN